MAATVTANLTEVSSADTTSSSGTWLGNSGGADTEVKIQGNGSYTWQASKNARTSCSFTPTTNLDMSAANTHLYWWAQNAVASFMETKTTGTVNTSGYHVRLTDGSGNYKEWHIAGSDTWGGEWRCFVLDVNSTTDVYASSGTLSLSDIDVITWYVDISNSGNIRIIDNQWNDVVRFGTGLTVTGTDFNLVDIAAIDESSTNKYGILENIDGVIFCQGKLQIGNGATTTTFNSDDETLIFRDRVSGNGLGQVASNFYELLFTGSGCTATINGIVAKGAGSTNTTRYDLTVSTSADATIDGSTFIRSDATNLSVSSATSDVQNSTFTDCGQINPGTQTFKKNKIVNYVGTDGSLLWPSDDTNIDNITFINCDNAVEYDAGSDSTPVFDAITFDDSAGNFDVNNTSGSTVTIEQTNGSNGNSYNTGNSTVTFSTSISLKIVVKDESNVVIASANAYIDDNNSTPYIMNTTTNASGIAETTWTGGAVTGATWRVRKYGYKPYKQIIDIGTTNKEQSVTLIADPQQT